MNAAFRKWALIVLSLAACASERPALSPLGPPQTEARHPRASATARVIDSSQLQWVVFKLRNAVAAKSIDLRDVSDCAFASRKPEVKVSWASGAITVEAEPEAVAQLQRDLELAAKTQGTQIEWIANRIFAECEAPPPRPYSTWQQLGDLPCPPCRPMDDVEKQRPRNFIDPRNSYERQTP